jgi:hypothetical protein
MKNHTPRRGTAGSTRAWRNGTATTTTVTDMGDGTTIKIQTTDPYSGGSRSCDGAYQGNLQTTGITPAQAQALREAKSTPQEIISPEPKQ